VHLPHLTPEEAWTIGKRINKVQASKPSGYRFGLSRNLSVFSTSINQYITLSYILDFNNNNLYSTLVVDNPLQHPSGVHRAYTHVPPLHYPPRSAISTGYLVGESLPERAAARACETLLGQIITAHFVPSKNSKQVACSARPKPSSLP
jgi:hypothetical protein